MRTRLDNSRVVVTEEEADRIDEEWEVISEFGSENFSKRPNYEEVKSRLRSQLLDREPLEEEVGWALLQEELIEHAERWDWGLYRNTRSSMAEQYGRERRLEEALTTYLEVCYLDLNGANNCGGFRDFPDLLKDFPPFDPAGAFLAPGIVQLIRGLMALLNREIPSVRDLFIEHNTAVHSKLSLPRSPQDAWLTLESGI